MPSRMSDIDAILKDVYAPPGARLKQWVINMHAVHAWEDETAPRVHVPPHLDNTGAECRNVGQSLWSHLSTHDCCSICNEVAGSTAAVMSEITAWNNERERRYAEAMKDRETFSDEVQPDLPLDEHPTLKLIKKP